MKSRLALVSIALLILLAGCSSRKIWINKVSISEPIHINVELYFRRNTPWQTQFNLLVDNYNLDHHDSGSVSAQTTSDINEYFKNIRTLAAGDQLPDIFVVEQNPREHSLQLSGELMDLKPYVEKMYWDLTMKQPQKYDENGKMLALYFQQPVLQLYYHQKLLKDVGYNYPPSSWDEFLKMCEKLHRKGVVPVALTSPKQSRLSIDLLFSIAQTTEKFDMSEISDWVKCLDTWKSIYSYMGEQDMQYNYSTSIDNWLEGNAAMFLDDSTLLGRIPDINDIGAYTILSNGKPLYGNPLGLAVKEQKDERKKKEVISFMDYVVKSELSIKLERQEKVPVFQNIKPSTDVYIMQNAQRLMSRTLSAKNENDLNSLLEGMLAGKCSSIEVAQWIKKNISSLIYKEDIR